MEERIAEIVQEHGWYAANVGDHQPPFLYSIGLMQSCGHPEFVVFGLDTGDSCSLLSCLVRDIHAGRTYAEPGIHPVSSGGDDHRIGFRRVHPTQHPLYLGFAMGYCRHIGRIGHIGHIGELEADCGRAGRPVPRRRFGLLCLGGCKSLRFALGVRRRTV